MIKKKILSLLLSSSCKNTIKSTIKKCENLLANFDINDVSAIRNHDETILKYYYRLIENTDFKDEKIKNNNEEYKNDWLLSNVMLSPESTYNDIKKIKPLKGRKNILFSQVLENSKSQDLVTKNFKDNKYAMDDEIFQKLGTWSNNLAHVCEEDIKTVAGSMNFDLKDMGSDKKNERELKKAQNKFCINIFNAQKLYKNEPKFACDIKEILSNIENYNNDLSVEEDPNLKKMLSLIKEFYPDQLVDKEFLKKFSYCLNVEDTAVDFYEMKNIGTKQLLMYQDRTIKKNISEGEEPYEEQTLITFIVPDEVKTKDGKPTCRVVTMNKMEYDKYIKYNNSYTIPQKYVETYSKRYNISQKDEWKTVDCLRKSQTGKELTSRERKALMAKCSVSSYHIPVDYVEDFLKEREITNINRSYPPLVEQLAYCGSALHDITPPQQKEKVLSNILEPQDKICMENKTEYEKKYPDPEEKFNDKHNVQKCFEKIYNKLYNKERSK